MVSWFENEMFRFGLSGTLIGLYGVADALALRKAGVSRHHEAASPRWVHPAIFVSITLYYFLIRPVGGPVLGGYGNLAGIALVLASLALRWSVRHGAPSVRYPAMATRMLFYFALPLAVGVPLGWLALTLPAWALSAWVALREDRRRLGLDEAEARARIASTARWVPGVW
jgi:hypothetical protein